MAYVPLRGNSCVSSRCSRLSWRSGRWPLETCPRAPRGANIPHDRDLGPTRHSIAIFLISRTRDDSTREATDAAPCTRSGGKPVDDGSTERARRESRARGDERGPTAAPRWSANNAGRLDRFVDGFSPTPRVPLWIGKFFGIMALAEVCRRLSTGGRSPSKMATIRLSLLPSRRHGASGASVEPNHLTGAKRPELALGPRPASPGCRRCRQAKSARIRDVRGKLA